MPEGKEYTGVPVRSLSIVNLIKVVAPVLSLALIVFVDAYAQSDTPNALDVPVLAAALSGSNSVDLNWGTVDGAARYELWVWWDDETGWQQLDGGNLTDTEFSHYELAAGRTYFYLVRAVSESGETGPWSERVSATIDGPGSTLAAPILSAEAIKGGVELVACGRRGEL